MKKIVLRADGSSTIGMGHVMRCLALYEMLEKDFTFSFAIHKPDQAVLNVISQYNIPVTELGEQLDTSFADNSDAVIVDGYWFDKRYIKEIKGKNKKVIQVDDLGGPEFFSDILINHSLATDYSGSEFPEDHRLLTGPQYALLRKEFLVPHRTLRAFGLPEAITINMGGADPQNYTLRILKALPENKNIKSVNVLIGGSYTHRAALNDWIGSQKKITINLLQGLSAPEVVSLFLHTDILICSASTIVYEAAAIGVPAACFLTADNQQNIYEGLVPGGYVTGLGDIQNMNESEIKGKLSGLFYDYKKTVQSVEMQQQLIDGLSGTRIKNAVLNLWP